MRIILVAVLLTTALASPLPAASGDVVVNDNSWPPYFFGEQAGHPPGFAREVLERCVATAGSRPIFRNVPVLRMYSMLERGELDVNLMSFKPERTALVRFGAEPLFRAGYRPIVRADSPVAAADDTADLDPLLLGHLRGLQYSDWFLAYVERRQAAGTVRVAESNEQLLEMLLAGKIDVFVNHAATARYLARRAGVAERIRILDLDVQTTDYFVVLAKASPRVADPEAFLAAVDACIAQGKADGWVGELEEKYGLR